MCSVSSRKVTKDITMSPSLQTGLHLGTFLSLHAVEQYNFATTFTLGVLLRQILQIRFDFIDKQLLRLWLIQPLPLKLNCLRGMLYCLPINCSAIPSRHYREM